MAEIFVKTSTTRSGPNYMDLSEHDFNESEKTWLCLSIVEGLDPADHLLKPVKKPSVSTMAERYVIPRSTVRNWVNIYTNNGLFLKHGRPLAIDEEGLSKIGEVLEDYHNEKHIDMYDNQLAAVVDAEVVISAKHKKKICYAILRINHVLKNYLKPSHIVDGFKITGQHVFDKEKASDQSTVSFVHVMSQCYKKLENEDYAVMQENAEAHIQTYRRTGRLSNEEMDNSNIWNTNDMVSRDDRQLSYQGAVLITHTDTVARYKDYRQIQLDNKNPEIIAARKALATAMRNLRKNTILNAQKETSEEAKRIKQREKQLEAERFAALTAAEKKLYKEKKKLENAGKRAVKNQERIDQIERDIIIVGDEASDHIIMDALMEVGNGDYEVDDNQENNDNHDDNRDDNHDDNHEEIEEDEGNEEDEEKEEEEEEVE